MQHRIAGKVAGGCVPSVEREDFFLRAEQGKRVEGGLAVGGHALDELCEIGEPALDRRLVVEIGVILALDDEPLVGLHEVEEQVEVDELLRIRLRGHFQSIDVDLIDTGFVDVEHHGNQRQAAGVAWQREFLKQRAERVVLIVIGFEHLFLGFKRELAEAARSPGGKPQRQEVEAMAYQLVAADARLARCWDADDQIVLPGEAMKQCGKCGKQGGEECSSEFRRRLFQTGIDFRIEFKRLHRSCIGFHLRARAVGREFEHGSSVGKLAYPEILRSGDFLAFLASDLEAGVIREGHGRSDSWQFACLAGVVGGGELREDHAERPAIADDVVCGEDQFVTNRGKSNEMNPEQRAGCQIEGNGTLRILDQRERKQRGRGVRGDAGEVVFHQLDGAAGRVEILGVSVLGEGAAQRRMADDEVVQRGSQCRGIEFSVEANDI